MKEQFEELNFTKKTAALISTASEIVEDYQARGYNLTLRQLYYQFVQRNLLPNTMQSYKTLGGAVRKARYAGLISWTSIEDRTRGVTSWMIEEDPEEVVRDIEYGLSLDYWSDQNAHCEVWVEKEALSDVVRRPSMRWRVPYLACKGYLSASEMWRAGKRFERMGQDGRELYIFHLGDHDPSGIDMTRDNEARVKELSWFADVNFRRIALNMDQVEEMRPPENPAKLTDSRVGDYLDRFGDASWELDAISPEVLDDLIDRHIREILDEHTWSETEEREEGMRETLAKIGPNWEEVSNFLQDL